MAENQFRLTKEESAIMNECRKMSFWRRSVPLMAITNGIMIYLRVTNKVSKQLYGLKVATALLGAYALGKVSYMGECQRMISENIPDSKLARWFDSKSYAVISDMAQPPEIVPKTNGLFNESNELDEFQIPLNVTNNEKTSTNKRFVTYDELREKNRSEYAAKFNAVRTRPENPATNSKVSEIRPAKTSRKNQFGDEVFD